MAGTPRSAKVRAGLEARAKAMRREGASMAEIERETGVPAPTLHQWAARGKWRLCDLEGESFLSSGPSGPSVLAARGQAPLAAGGYSPFERSALGESGVASHSASGLGTPDLQGPQGRPPARSEDELVSSVARNRPQGGPGGQEKSGPGALPSPSCLPKPTPENLLTLAETAKAEAMRLFAAGQVKRAREYLLTAQRFVVAAGGAKASGEAGHTDAELARAELERRLLKLIPREMALYLKAIAGGEGALEAYLADRDTSRVYKWRDHFWWPDLFAARIAHPPYGFVNEHADDWDGKRPYLNAWLAMVVPDP